MQQIIHFFFSTLIITIIVFATIDYTTIIFSSMGMSMKSLHFSKKIRPGVPVAGNSEA